MSPLLRTMPNRRCFLHDSFCGFGSLALASMLHDERARAAVDSARQNSLASKPAHNSDAQAKSVIFLFMAGGPSHVDTFDPKPLLNKLDGQPRPTSFGDGAAFGLRSRSCSTKRRRAVSS